MAIKKILIVDDEPSHQLNLKHALSKVGCRIITASSGMEAIAKAKTERPDLIFMDIIMDDMDGYNACRKINHDPQTKDIPVVFVSSKHQKVDKIWARKQGGRALIAKPFTQDQILDQVRIYA